MKSYVNAQIIHLEQRLIEREYKGDFRLWALCAKEVTKELSITCQWDAYHTLNGHRPMFAILRSEIMSNKLTGLQTRELEVYLPAFRDYVNLQIMELIPLIKTYCAGSTGLDKKQCNHYSQALQEAMKFAKTYVQKAVDVIIKYHEAGACKQTFKCTSMHDVHEGMWKAYTKKEGSCQCVLDYGTEQICKAPVQIREDGKHPPDYVRFYWTQCSNGQSTCAENTYGKFKLFPIEKKYVAEDVKVVKAYWKSEVLSFIPEWDNAYKFGTDHIKPAGDAGDAEFEDVLSPQFTERLIKAYDYPRKYH